MELSQEVVECLLEVRAAITGVVCGSARQLEGVKEALTALKGLEACLELAMEQVRADAREDAETRVKQAESVAVARLAEADEANNKKVNKYREEIAELRRKLTQVESAASQQRENAEAETAKKLRKQSDTIAEWEAKCKDLRDRLEDKRCDIAKLIFDRKSLQRDHEKREEKLNGRLEGKRSDVAELKDEIKLLKRDAEKREEELNTLRNERKNPSPLAKLFKERKKEISEHLNNDAESLQNQPDHSSRGMHQNKLRRVDLVPQSTASNRKQLPVGDTTSNLSDQSVCGDETTHESLATVPSADDPLGIGHACVQPAVEAVADDQSRHDVSERRPDDLVLGPVVLRPDQEPVDALGLDEGPRVDGKPEFPWRAPKPNTCTTLSLASADLQEDVIARVIQYVDAHPDASVATVGAKFKIKKEELMEAGFEFGAPLRDGNDRRLRLPPNYSVSDNSDLHECRRTLLKCLREEGGRIKAGEMQRFYHQNPGFKEQVHQLGGVAGMCRKIAEVNYNSKANAINLVRAGVQKDSETLSVAEGRAILLDAVNAGGGKLHGSRLASLYDAHLGFKQFVYRMGGARGVCGSGSGIEFNCDTNTFIKAKKRLAHTLQASARKRLKRS